MSQLPPRQRAVSLRWAFGLGGLAILFLIVTAVNSYRDLQTLHYVHSRVARKQEVLAQLERVMGLITDAETGQRGYLLTDQEEYLEPYRAAEATLHQELERLKVLTADNAALSQRFAELPPLIDERFRIMSSTIALLREQKREEALNLVVSGEGKAIMDQIRRVIGDMERSERHLLQSRLEIARRSLWQTQLVLGLALLAILILTGAAGYLLARIVSLQRGTAARLDAEREWLQVTLGSIGDAVLATDAQGRVLFLNEVARGLMGRSLQEVAGRPIADVFPIVNELTRQPAENPVSHVLREGRVVGLANHTILIAADGTERPIDDSAAPIRDRAGAVQGVVLVFRDVTERRRAEQRVQFLAEMGSTLGSIVDSKSTLEKIARQCAPVFSDVCLIDQVDEDGRVSRTAVAHGDPGKEALFRGANDGLLFDWSSTSAPAAVLKTGRPELIGQLSREILDPWAGGSDHRQALDALVPGSIMAVPLLHRRRVVGVLTFVNSRSRARFNEDDFELAQELGRRTATALDNVQLYQDLRDANKRKDEFLAMLAHELRNPLAAIQYANALSRSPMAGEPDIDCAGMIDKQVQQLKRLIDDLLDVSRITRGHIELRRETLDARTIAERAAEAARPFIRDRRQQFELEVSAEPLAVSADPARLEQMIVNLLSNAAKYTPEGGRISLRAAREGQRAVVGVSDSGVGIAPDMLARIFDLFTQVDPSLERAAGGLGIGLTVVRRLARLHGGDVEAASAGLGKGSQFTLWLPIVAAVDVAGSAKPVPDAVSATTKRILVVEDNVDTARGMELLLRQSGHSVRVCYDGHSALDAAREGHPDVILLDLGLPGMDGYQLAQALRREEYGKRARLVAISGYGQEEDRKRSQHSGFDEHLVKPVDMAVLLSVVDGHDSHTIG